MQVRLASHAMGTRFELVLEGDETGPSESPLLRAAGEAALAEIEDVDRRLSLFRRDSLLSHINRLAHRQPVRLDLDLFELFGLCRDVCRRSQGAFDPTVAPLMRAWGLHEEQASSPDLPLDAARERVGWEQWVRLEGDPPRISLGRAGVALDLGAVAKGYALDLAAAALREAGVSRALLHGGTSTVLAIGRPRGRGGWPISIGDGPDAPQVALTDGSLSVSAPTGRSVLDGSREVTHVLDPRSGEPARGLAVSAVLSPCAAEADAWSTALLVSADPTPLPDHLEALLGLASNSDSPAPESWEHKSADSPDPANHFSHIPTSLHIA